MPTPLLAFGWTSLPMLGWLAVAAAPWLIHLWSRRNYRETSWAAMAFLAAAMKRQSRRLLLEQRLLLAIRTLLVVLVVLAVAEPYTQRPGLVAPANGNTHRVLVVDGSYSMAYRPTDKKRFERAKELARRIVEQSPQGDAFTLALMASPPRVVVASPTLEPTEMIREIESLRMPEGMADLPATVAAIRQVIEDARRDDQRLARHEVYFLTDLQRVDWTPKLPEAATAEFLRKTEELSQLGSLFVIDFGQSSAENLAVTRLQAIDTPAIVGRTVQFEVDVKNFGRQAKSRQPVELLIDGRRVEQKEIDVGPGGTAMLRFKYRVDAAGDHAIEARAVGDALDVDNHRYLALPVRQAIRVLCIDGRPSGKPFRGAAEYLAVALSPQKERADHAPIQTETVSEDAILNRRLGGYDCVFLCNVAQFTASEAQALDAYLESGGSVVFFLGDQVSADRYNRELGGAGQGGKSRVGDHRPRILPATIGEIVDRPQLRIDPLGYRHPIVQAFRGTRRVQLVDHLGI